MTSSTLPFKGLTRIFFYTPHFQSGFCFQQRAYGRSCWQWLNWFRKSSTARVHSRSSQTEAPSRKGQKKIPTKNSQRFLNENDLLEALTDLQTRSQEIFGKT